MTKLIRVPDPLYEAIAKVATAQQRSITAQTAILLDNALAEGLVSVTIE